MIQMKGLKAKDHFFVVRHSTQDHKGVSDTRKLLIPLACEILFRKFHLLFKHYF